jgi:hypothetical protein
VGLSFEYNLKFFYHYVVLFKLFFLYFAIIRTIMLTVLLQITIINYFVYPIAVLCLNVTFYVVFCLYIAGIIHIGLRWNYHELIYHQINFINALYE